MSKDLKQGKNDLIDLGVLGITVGTLARAFYPSPPIVFLGYAVGIGSFVFNVLGKKYKEYDTIFQNCNLINRSDMLPQLKEIKKTEYGKCLRFSLPPGLSLSDFKREQEAIEQFLNKKINIKYSNKNILIEVFEKELQAEYPFKLVTTKGIVEIVVGMSYKGIETVDLCPSKGNVHMLLASQTGGGKSTLLRQIILTILLTKSVDDIDLSLLDLKGTEFQIFRGCSDMIKRYATTITEATKVIQDIRAEVDRRNELFKRANVVDILEYNKKYKNKKLKYEIVVIDEFHLLRGEKKDIAIMEELAAISRSTGIHLILVTQSPRAEVVTGLLKSNIPTILGLRTNSSLNSRIILDSDELSDLRGRGHGILQKAGQNTEIQGMNIDTKQARDLLKTLNNTSISVENIGEFVPKKQVKEVKEVEKTGIVKNFDFLKKLSS